MTHGGKELALGSILSVGYCFRLFIAEPAPRKDKCLKTRDTGENVHLHPSVRKRNRNDSLVRTDGYDDSIQVIKNRFGVHPADIVFDLRENSGKAGRSGISRDLAGALTEGIGGCVLAYERGGRGQGSEERDVALDTALEVVDRNRKPEGPPHEEHCRGNDAEGDQPSFHHRYR